MSTALAIFVKTPGLSPVKTRLAASLGTPQAVHFYQLCVKAITATAKQSGLPTYWAVAEEEGLSNPLWQDFPQLHTSPGNLGERQGAIYETLRKDFETVLLVGADIPQLSVSILHAARASLKNHDFVLGPAKDGGYYLFGGRTALPKHIWRDVPWSTPQTMQKLEEALPSPAAHLQSLTDIDTVQDLLALPKEMGTNATPEQEAILSWIKSL